MQRKPNDPVPFAAWMIMGALLAGGGCVAGAGLAGGVLPAFCVVLLDQLPRDVPAYEVDMFAASVSAGGGLASMTGYKDDTAQDWHANSLLAPLGLAYALPRSWGPVTQYAAHPI